MLLSAGGRLFLSDSQDLGASHLSGCLLGMHHCSVHFTEEKAYSGFCKRRLPRMEWLHLHRYVFVNAIIIFTECDVTA